MLKLIVLALFVPALCSVSIPTTAQTQTVTVDARRVFQTMDGWSTEERIWDDPHLTNTYRPPHPGEVPFGRSAVNIPLAAQNEILDKMYKELKLTQVHAVLDRGAQASRESAIDLRWKFNDGHIDWVKQAIPHGLKRWALFFYALENWMSRTDPTDLVDWEMAHLRRWKALGVEPHFIFPFSEPSYNQRGPALSPFYMRELIRGLGRKLSTEGFRTRILAPDDLNPQLSFVQLQTIMADAEVRGYMAAITTHMYGSRQLMGHLTNIRDQFATPYHLPIWMTEDFAGHGGLNGSAFDYAELMHDLIANYDVSHVNYEWGYFGQWENGQANLISITYDASAKYAGYRFEKSYYTFGQFSRFVGPGSRRMAVMSTDAALKITAYKDTGKTVIVAINNTRSAKTVTFHLIGLASIAFFQPTRTSESENWAVLQPIPVSGAEFSAVLPPVSITTFSSPGTVTSSRAQ